MGGQDRRQRERVHLAVLTLGYSRRLLVRAFHSEKQEHWLAEKADLRIHSTAGYAPLERFLREQAQALQAFENKLSFLAEGFQRR